MITFDHTKASADFANFPVLVDIIDPDLVIRASADGHDIVFTDDSGTKLNHEIESYDNTTGHLICWVSTNMSSTSDTKLYMYYGNADSSNQENPTAAWDPGYDMVQHLAESAGSYPTDWYKYEGNPTLNGSKNGFASVFYDSGVYHLFCSWGSVLHFTSSDGKTGWVADPLNPVLSGNNEGVPMVWKDPNGTWYMLYRYGGPDKIGLANSIDASHWTRYEGNPVINVGSFCDPWGVIKVGSTYYLWVNDGFGGSGRGAELATSTDLIHWTFDTNAIFAGGRFCVFPFKYGDYYYMLVPRYTTSPYGEIELYRDTNPTFYESSRVFLGVIIKPGQAGTWDDHRFDTPCVLTDTIYRDSYTAANNELWTYYAATGSLTGSGADFWTGMCIEQNITDALTRFGSTAYTHHDSTSNNNNGQANGNLNMNVTGRIDGADSFDGVSAYINCGDSPTLKGMTGLTVEAWVRPNAVRESGIVAKWNSWAPGAGGSYILWQSGTGSVGWGVITETSTAYLYDTPMLQPGEWYHLVGTYDGSQIKLYINGTQAGTPTSITGRIASNTYPCYIGRYTTPFMNGTIDEVRISNVSRSADWIRTEYNNQENPSTFCSVGFEETRVRAELIVSPSLTEKYPSDVDTTFALNVSIRNVTDLLGFDFNLTWGNDLIELVGVDYESQLDEIWGPGDWVMVKNQTASGWYKLVAVSTRSGFNSVADQPLAKLTFRVRASYNWRTETPLHFAVVKLSDSHANPIYADAVDGTYRMEAQKPLIELTPNNVTCRKFAERFSIALDVDKVAGVKDLAFELHYNTTLLDYVSGSDIWGDLGTGTVTANETAGTVTGSVSSPTTIDGRHWLLNLTFQDALRHIWRNETLVPGWRNNQTGTIMLHWANLSYIDHTDLQYQEGGADQILVTGMEYVFSPIQGDVNNDGEVDIFDLRTVACYYEIDSSKPEWIEASKYDLNGDNIIDIFDIVIVVANFQYKYDC
jgi:hypothetical protein